MNILPGARRFPLPVVLSAFLALGTGWAAPVTKPDPVTGFPREVREQKEWPSGRKVAVCFVLYVESWGFGQGPSFRSDMANRSPDLVNLAFLNYAIDFGLERVGGVFQEAGVPLSVALNALFPGERPEVWQRLRALHPNGPILGHGMNNSTNMLPMARGLAEQEKYVAQTLDLIERETGVRPRGWSSPSVYFNADTFRATAANGITYTLDSMDSDHLSVLRTPEGRQLLIPYPPTSVDMGQFLARYYKPADMERLWIDYVGELAREAQKHPERPATVVAIGIHPFVVGSPDGAAALRRTLEALQKLPGVWLTDTDAVVRASGFTAETE